MVRQHKRPYYPLYLLCALFILLPTMSFANCEEEIVAVAEAKKKYRKISDQVLATHKENNTTIFTKKERKLLTKANWDLIAATRRLQACREDGF